MRFHDYGLRLQTAFHGQQRTYATVSAAIPADGTKRRQCDGDVNINTVTKLKNFDFREVEGPQLVRSLDDFDYAVINGHSHA